MLPAYIPRTTSGKRYIVAKRWLKVRPLTRSTRILALLSPKVKEGICEGSSTASEREASTKRHRTSPLSLQPYKYSAIRHARAEYAESYSVNQPLWNLLSYDYILTASLASQ